MKKNVIITKDNNVFFQRQNRDFINQYLLNTMSVWKGAASKKTTVSNN